MCFFNLILYLTLKITKKSECDVISIYIIMMIVEKMIIDMINLHSFASSAPFPKLIILL